MCVDINNEDKINVLSEKVRYRGSCTEKIDRLYTKVCDLEDFMDINNMVKKLIDVTKGLIDNNAEICRQIQDISSENVRLADEVKVL